MDDDATMDADAMWGLVMSPMPLQDEDSNGGVVAGAGNDAHVMGMDDRVYNDDDVFRSPSSTPSSHDTAHQQQQHVASSSLSSSSSSSSIPSLTTMSDPPVPAPLTLEVLIALLDQMYDMWCGGNMNPYERMCRILGFGSEVAPTANDGGTQDDDNNNNNTTTTNTSTGFARDMSSFVDAILTNARGQNVDLGVSSATAAGYGCDAFVLFLASDLMDGGGDNNGDDNNGDDVNNNFIVMRVVVARLRQAYLRIARLRTLFILLNVHKATDMGQKHRIAIRFKNLLARIHDMQQMFVFTNLSLRESCASIGYSEFHRHADVLSLVDSTFTFEGATQILDPAYSTTIQEVLEGEDQRNAELVNAGGTDCEELVNETLMDPLDYYLLTGRRKRPRPESGYGDADGDADDVGGGNDDVDDGLVGGGGGRGRGRGGRGRGRGGRGRGRGRGRGNHNTENGWDTLFGESDENASVSVVSASAVGKTGGENKRFIPDASVFERRFIAIWHHFLARFNHFGLHILERGPQSAGVILLPRFTSNGSFTRCFEKRFDSDGRPLDVAKVVACMSHSMSRLGSIMAKFTAEQSIVSQLIGKMDPQFPVHQSDRLFISFEDGILCVDTVRFYPYSDIRSGGVATVDNQYASLFSHYGSGGGVSALTSVGAATGLCNDLQRIQQSYACAYVDSHMGRAYNGETHDTTNNNDNNGDDASESFVDSFVGRVLSEVSGRLYPVASCDTSMLLNRSPCPCCTQSPRVRHPQPDSANGVFHCYVDLVTDIFRRCVEEDPTMIDEVFGIQVGLDTREGTPMHMKQCSPTPSAATHRLQAAVDRILADGVALQKDARETATATASSAAAGAATAQHQSSPSVEGSQQRVFAALVEHVQAALVLTDSAAVCDLSSMRAARVDLQDAMTKIATAIHTTTTTNTTTATAATNATTTSRGGASSSSTSTSTSTAAADTARRIASLRQRYLDKSGGGGVSNDKDAEKFCHDGGLTDAQVLRFATREHAAYRALIMVYGVLGTYFVPRLSKHDISIAMWLNGLSGTGKTIVMDTLFKLVYGKDHISVINNNMEKEFGLAPIIQTNTFVAIANEITPDTTFPRTTYLTWVTDPAMRVPRKNVDSYEINPVCKPMFCCNLMPMWQDEGGSDTQPGNVLRRSMVILFHVSLVRQMRDAEFRARMKKRIPTILLRILACRKLMVPIFSIQTFWSRGSPVVKLWHAEVAAQMRPFTQLMHGLGLFEYGADFLLTENDLRIIVKKFCSRNSNLTGFSWDDLMTFILSHKKVHVVTNRTYNYKNFDASESVKLTTKYITGVRYTNTANALYATPLTSGLGPRVPVFDIDQNRIAFGEFNPNHQQGHR